MSDTARICAEIRRKTASRSFDHRGIPNEQIPLEIVTNWPNQESVEVCSVDDLLTLADEVERLTEPAPTQYAEHGYHSPKGQWVCDNPESSVDDFKWVPAAEFWKLEAGRLREALDDEREHADRLAEEVRRLHISFHCNKENCDTANLLADHTERRRA